MNTSKFRREQIMRQLKRLLIRKIAITGIFWCLPLLAFPTSWFVALGFPTPEPLLFVRLLGAAYFALLVGYYMGMRGLVKGESPAQVIYMGIVSNGLACSVLMYFGSTGAWASWLGGAQVFMWLSAFGALIIAFNLFRLRQCI
jgi:hypothetical protein